MEAGDKGVVGRSLKNYNHVFEQTTERSMIAAAEAGLSPRILAKAAVFCAEQVAHLCQSSDLRRGLEMARASLTSGTCSSSVPFDRWLDLWTGSLSCSAADQAAGAACLAIGVLLHPLQSVFSVPVAAANAARAAERAFEAVSPGNLIEFRCKVAGFLAPELTQLISSANKGA